MYYKLLYTCLTFFLFFSLVRGQTISFPDYWLFKTGDDNLYKRSNIPDNDWAKVRVPAAWESQGFNEYNGYAWYRLHFNVNKSDLSKELYILAGVIDDIDETYLNGKLIGSTGKMPPKEESAWNVQRIYKVPQNLLKENNVLAIRVYDGVQDGGIREGVTGIYDKESYMREFSPGPAPKKSFYQVGTSNGLIAAVYNEKRNAIENVFPHIFRMYDEDIRVNPFIKNLKLRYTEKPQYVGYEKNTHIIKIEYPDFTLRYFAPFKTEQKIFYLAAEGKQQFVDTLSLTFEKDYCEVLIDSALLKNDNGTFTKYFLFSFNDSVHNNNSAIEEATARLLSINPVHEELNFMRSVIDNANKPSKLSSKERDLYEQSISILKMAQVSQKEVFVKSRGQILASLPPGLWNVGWLRDGVYATLALNRLGMFKEAKDALNFVLNADAGYYKHYVHTDGIDYGIKSDYQVSVCRYFGMGKEESDFNNNGPNIELDGFGLFLIAYSDYISRSNDKEFLKETYDIVKRLIADPILTFIDSNNIIRTESGPWESHLPGKQFAFTSIVNSAGLRDFYEICKSNGIESPEEYSHASELLNEGISKNFIYKNIMLKGFASAESPSTMDFYDGGTIEAFNYGILNDPQFFKSYYKEYTKGLRISPEKGFSRLNNPDWYTISEWPFLNLRIASALLNFDTPEAAKQLIDRTTDYSSMNFNYVAELYNYDNENYGGAIPMVGYGAGAYIITLNDFYRN